MFMLMVVLVSSLFFYSNVLYYSVSLIIFSLLMLSYLVKSLIVSPVVMGLLMIVYIGAMMVLIGYICAVCPNLILSSSGNFLLISAFFILFFLFGSPSISSSETGLTFLSDYFYGASFMWLFLIALVLFITLLMVTSHYLTPKGPFRSL